MFQQEEKFLKTFWKITLSASKLRIQVTNRGSAGGTVL